MSVRVCLVWCVQSVVSCVRVCETCELHERSPCPNFVERTPDETTSFFFFFKKKKTLQRSTLLLKLQCTC